MMLVCTATAGCELDKLDRNTIEEAVRERFYCDVEVALDVQPDYETTVIEIFSSDDIATVPEALIEAFVAGMAQAFSN